MAALVKFQDFKEQLGKKQHDLSADTLRVFLTDTAPNAATMALKADLVGEIAYTNISGGVAPALTKTYTETAGVGTLAANVLVITATDTVPDFRYYGIFNDTSTGDMLIAYWDHGSVVSLADTETFTITFGGASPGTILTID